VKGKDMHLQNLESKAIENTTFRTVLATSKHTQVVVMSVNPGEDIGMEIHPNEDQVLYLVSGKGKVFLNGDEFDFNSGDAVLVPAGAKHNFTTVGEEPMKIITTYSPPHHPDGTVHKTKADAEAAEAEH
jgi:mannose-6-phosphate isomerase-like protein (cupin superfamily)